MAGWNHKVQIKHLFTDDEDHESVQASMNAIADVLQNDSWFVRFSEIPRMRAIPPGDDTFAPVDYANRILDYVYDFADAERIWIE